MLYRLALQDEARKKQELVKEAEEMSTKQVISSLAIHSVLNLWSFFIKSFPPEI